MSQTGDFTEIRALLDFLHDNGGRLILSYSPGRALSGNSGPAIVGLEFGSEAADSDMAGGAAYGQANNLDDALIDVARQVGIQ